MNRRFNTYKPNIHSVSSNSLQGENFNPLQEEDLNPLKEDFMIISLNENNKDFKEEDVKGIIKKIQEKNPAFLYVCTHESKANRQKHFQHVLMIELLIIKLDNTKKNLNATYNVKTNNQKFKLLFKHDASHYSSISALFPIFFQNRNVRTRLYYNVEHVNICKKVELLGGLRNQIFKNRQSNIIDKTEDEFFINKSINKKKK
jgi:hypothetical protein